MIRSSLRGGSISVVTRLNRYRHHVALGRPTPRATRPFHCW